MSYTSSESGGGDDNGIIDCSRSSNRYEGNVLKKGPWSSDEDDVLIDYVKKYGEGNWNAVQKHTGLFRCGKSCRLRWANHLRPNLKKGAFSQEEEQLIVELHAKIGNRWARMAAHLPGRTDNEIKNYWNTRTKRRERAGLPLYPPQMHVEVLDWSQDYNKSMVLGGDEDFLQESNVYFNGFNSVTDSVPYASYLEDMAACIIHQGNGVSSPQYENFMPPEMPPSAKRLRGCESLYPWCSGTIKEEYPSPEHFQNSETRGISVPCDVDHHLYGSQHSPVVIPDSHTFTDGIVPASKSSFEALKLELPSFQYPEATYDQWKTSSSPPPPHSDPVDSSYIQSPPPPSSDSFSDCNTGLLDMLLLEAKVRNNRTYKCYASATSTTDVAEVGLSHIKSEEFDDSFKSLLHSDIYADRQREKERKPVLDMTRPDVLLASSWLDHGLGIVKETNSMSDAFAVLLGGDDIRNDYMHISAEGASSGVVGSCPWSNMPPVCQMTELP